MDTNDSFFQNISYAVCPKKKSPFVDKLQAISNKAVSELQQPELQKV